MDALNRALQTLSQYRGDQRHQDELTFLEFLREVVLRPERNIRNVTQVYADMVQ